MRRRCSILILFFCLSCHWMTAQKIGERTNLLYWATTSPNFGLEIAVHEKWSIVTMVGYNPWDFPDDASLRHWLVRAEPRWWLCRPFTGHFFGVHGMYGTYNVGNIPFIKDFEDYVYKGDLYGGGISYGYHFVLKGRWGLELSVGAGFLRLDYEKYACSDCRDVIGKYTKNYFGPTQIGVSLIYLLK